MKKKIDFSNLTLEEAKNYAFESMFISTSKFNYGDTYTIDKFIELVKDASIIDYDGIGYAAFEIEGHLYEFKEMEIYCDVDWLEAKKEMGITHIRWYNK